MLMVSIKPQWTAQFLHPEISPATKGLAKITFCTKIHGLCLSLWEMPMVLIKPQWMAQFLHPEISPATKGERKSRFHQNQWVGLLAMGNAYGFDEGTMGGSVFAFPPP